MILSKKRCRTTSCNGLEANDILNNSRINGIQPRNRLPRALVDLTTSLLGSLSLALSKTVEVCQ